MAKKKKKPTRWQIPAPTPFDAMRNPDLTDHIGELMLREIKRTSPGPVSQEKFNRYAQHYAELFDTYSRQLNKLYPAIDDLLSLDQIDVTSLQKQLVVQPQEPAMIQYLSSLRPPIYGAIPCFAKGMLFTNETRAIFFEIKSIDPDVESYTVFLRHYTRTDTQEPWQVGVSGEVTINMCTVDGQIADNHQVNDNTVEEFTDIYTRIPPSQLHWPREDVRLWEHVVLQNAVDQKARFAVLTGQENGAVASLARIFYYSILLSNFYLSKFKPKIERTPKDTKKPTNTRPKSVPNEPSAQRIRTVGTIKFVSARPPRQVNEKTVRTYRLASWPTRGHTRTYKSGKTVYIKPTVHHRKSLNDQGVQGTQSIIKIKQS